MFVESDLIAKYATRDTLLTKTIKKLDLVDLEHGPWIAGGAALHVAMEIELKDNSDIDFFFQNQEQMSKIDQTMKRLCQWPYNANPAFVEYRVSTKIPKSQHFPQDSYISTQLIKSYFSTSLVELFNKFDFTICAFATDGNVVIGTKQAWADLESKTLRLAYEIKPKSFWRVIKYCAAGFTPVPGLLTGLANTSLTLQSSTRTKLKKEKDYVGGY